MQIKVCGMTCAENLRQLQMLDIDYFGHIFYPRSKRAVSDAEVLELPLMEGQHKIAVFVDENWNSLKNRVEEYGFNFVQLHGSESAEFCAKVRELGVRVIKAIPIKEVQDLELCHRYKDVIDYFLFDTKGKLRGGNGRSFDWSVLESYALDVPFFLSGGIGPGDPERIKEFYHPCMYGIDINSCFEDKPGIKNIPLIKTFLNDLSY